MTRRRQGFTLVELLVVLAVLGVVSTIGLRGFLAVTQSWEIAAIRNDLESVADRVFERMRDDIACVTSAELTGMAIFGEEAMEMRMRYERVPLEDDFVILPVTLPPGAGPGTSRAQIMYRIDRGATPVLERTMAASGQRISNGVSDVVGEGVLAMRIEYLNDATWLPEWRQATHPRALRVTLVVQSTDRPWEQVSRSAVFPVRVR